MSSRLVVLKVRLTLANRGRTRQPGLRATRTRHAGRSCTVVCWPPGYVKAGSFRIDDVAGLKA